MWHLITSATVRLDYLLRFSFSVLFKVFYYLQVFQVVTRNIYSYTIRCVRVDKQVNTKQILIRSYYLTRWQIETWILSIKTKSIEILLSAKNENSYIPLRPKHFMFKEYKLEKQYLIAEFHYLQLRVTPYVAIDKQNDDNIQFTVQHKVGSIIT